MTDPDALRRIVARKLTREQIERLRDDFLDYFEIDQTEDRDRLNALCDMALLAESLAARLVAAERVVTALEAHHGAVSYVDGGDEDRAWDAVQAALGQFQMRYREAARASRTGTGERT